MVSSTSHRAGPVASAPAPVEPGPALSERTTLRLGGPARRFVRAGTAEEVAATAGAADAAGEPLLVLGGGSNLVVGDAGVEGTTLLLDSAGLRHGRRADGSVLLTVEAGEDWDTVVAATVAEGLGGFECLSGIPGRVGATPVQNVGAYGVEIADLLVDVDLYDRRRREVWTVPAAELGLGFRTSRLKRSDDAIVLRARFALSPNGQSAPIRYGELAGALDVAAGTRVPVGEARSAVLALRRGKGMVLDADDHDTWSAGSFFVNPILDDATAERIVSRCEADGQVPPVGWPAGSGRTKLSAAALIERAGFTRGHPGPGGRVSLSTKHALALTHRGGGSTDALLALAREIRDGVRDRFDVVLEPEPVLVGCTL